MHVLKSDVPNPTPTLLCPTVPFTKRPRQRSALAFANSLGLGRSAKRLGLPRDLARNGARQSNAYGLRPTGGQNQEGSRGALHSKPRQPTRQDFVRLYWQHGRPPFATGRHQQYHASLAELLNSCGFLWSEGPFNLGEPKSESLLTPRPVFRRMT